MRFWERVRNIINLILWVIHKFTHSVDFGPCRGDLGLSFTRI